MILRTWGGKILRRGNKIKSGCRDQAFRREEDTVHTVCYKGKGSEVGGKKEGGVLGGVCARCRGGDYGEIKCC